MPSLFDPEIFIDRTGCLVFEDRFDEEIEPVRPGNGPPVGGCSIEQITN